MNKEKILKAGKIAAEIKIWIKPQIKKGIPLLEIAEKIEKKIIELGGKPAFPCNLSINEIAAHYTPTHDDKTLAHGLLKVDFGVHIDGWTADTAFSIDLENSELNKKLIEAATSALDAAQKTIKPGIKTSLIGRAIEKAITEKKFNPIINLSGHQMTQYYLHAGNSIPNIDDDRATIIEPGLYAIEPFATNGNGKIKDGPKSTIYMLEDTRTPRGNSARELLEFIDKEYRTLPFCERWIVKKFKTSAIIALRELERNGNLHHFSQLVEKPGAIVAQKENTFFVDDKVTVTTE
jgi:methionyl aminopeptidase